MAILSYTEGDKNCYQLGVGDIWVPLGAVVRQRLGDVIYRYGPTIGQERFAKYPNVNPRTAAQQGWRLVYMDAYTAWNALSDGEREPWREEAKGIYLTAYCVFIANYLRTHQPYARVAIVNFGIVDQDWVGA